MCYRHVIGWSRRGLVVVAAAATCAAAAGVGSGCSASRTSEASETASGSPGRGTAPPPAMSDDAYDDVDAIARHFDRASAYLDEWGTMMLGGPYVVTGADQLRFDPGLTAEDIYKGTNQLGGSASVSRKAAISAGVKAKLAPKLAALAEAAAGDAAAQPAATPEPGGEQADSEEGDAERVEAPDRGENQALELLSEIERLLEVPDDQTNVDQSRRIQLAASDWFTLSMHKLASGAGVGKSLSDYSLAYAVTSVVCQPGWRTRSGYIGQLDATVSYRFDGELPRGGQWTHHPMVVAVYPSFDSQELDLRNSSTDLRAFAFDLAVAGATTGARLFLDAADQLDRTAQTQSSNVLITGHSNGGLQFGYEFRPDFRALQRPATKKTDSGYQLEPVSFPVAIVLAFHRDDVPSVIRAGFEKNLDEMVKDDDARLDSELQLFETTVTGVLGTRPADARDAFHAELFLERLVQFSAADAAERERLVAETLTIAGHAGPLAPATIDAVVKAGEQLLERGRKRTSLRFRASHSWRPLGEIATDRWTKRTRTRPDAAPACEVHRAEAIVELEKGGDLMFGAAWETAGQKESEEFLRKRYNAIGYRLKGSSPQIPIAIPFDAPPKQLAITGVGPAKGTTGQANTFFVHGTGFDASTAVSLFKGGAEVVPSSSVSLDRLGGSVLALKLTPAQSTKGSDYTVRVERGDGAATHSHPFAIADPPKAPTQKTVDLTVGRQDGEITSLRAPKGALEAEDTETFDRLLLLLERLRPGASGDSADAAQEASVDLEVRARREP